MENQRLYTIIDRLNTRGSDHTSDTASQLSDLSSYAPREVTPLPQLCTSNLCLIAEVWSAPCTIVLLHILIKLASLRHTMAWLQPHSKVWATTAREGSQMHAR